MAEATLMPTRTRPSAMSPRPSGIRERADRRREAREASARTGASGIALLAWRADELSDGAEELGAFDRLGERPRRPRLDRGLLGAALPRAEMTGHGDKPHSRTFLFHP